MLVTPYSTTNPNFQSSFYDRFFKNLPNKEIKNTDAYNRLGHTLASPHWNRVALGIAAITCQPTIDYLNPRVDRDTATIAAIRTASKAAVCMTVGFLVRGACFKLVNKYVNGSEKEGSTLLTPKEIINEKNKLVRDSKVKLHRNALSTVTALCVMLFTNFLIDAPVTTFVTNRVTKRYKENLKQEGGICA